MNVNLVKVVLTLLSNIVLVGSLEILNVSMNPDVVLKTTDLNSCLERTNPTLNGECLEVKVAVSIMDIDEIDEKHMEFRLHGYITIQWINSQLNLLVTNHTRPLLLPKILSDCMWKPDVIFPNSKKIVSFVDTVPNLGYKYLPNGRYYRVERLMLTVGCPMEFSMFPMDTQNCVLKVSLITSTDDRLVLTWNKVSEKWNGVYFSYHFEPLQFHVENPKIYSAVVRDYTGNFTELRANITFHRRFIGNFVNFYVPSTLVVFLSWISFYIKVDAAPARVCLGVTSLLTTTTQIIQARNTLPPVQYITAIDIWLFACLSLIFASFLEYSVAYSFQTNKHVKSNDDVCNIFDKHSRWVFPLCMIIFNIVYWSHMIKAYKNFK